MVIHMLAAVMASPSSSADFMLFNALHADNKTLLGDFKNLYCYRITHFM